MCPILRICCEAFFKFILYSIILFGSIVHMLVAVRPFVYVSINKKNNNNWVFHFLKGMDFYPKFAVEFCLLGFKLY